MKKPKDRIIGIDVARALAIIGMILVNFKTVLGPEGNYYLKLCTSFFDGKAAATFVVLAGVGMSLMAKNAIAENDGVKIKLIKANLWKRALFLWIFGLLFYLLWPADILHFYAVYILISTFFLTSSSKVLWGIIVIMNLVYPILVFDVIPYETGWNFETYDYLDFWSLKGFFRNLFINGFHPVLPWLSFMLFGIWFGRKNLKESSFLKNAILSALVVFILVKLLSLATIEILIHEYATDSEEIRLVFGLEPMPPFPYYIISGCSIAVIVISMSIFASNWMGESRIIQVLAKTGQLALSFYVAHVVLGMVLILAVSSQEVGTYSLEFSTLAAIVFSLFCLIIGPWWKKYFKQGPLEWFMRKLTG